MDCSDDPIKAIDELIKRHQHLDDDKLLIAIAQCDPLPDEDEPQWDSIEFWHENAYLLDALTKIACTRKLEASIPLVLERMCFGDPGEMMRGVCHGFEYIVAPDYERLAPLYERAAQSERPGTREWALRFLCRLRDRATLPIFEKALNDPIEEVRDAAARGVELCKTQES